MSKSGAGPRMNDDRRPRLLPVVSWITGRALGLVLWWRIPSRDRIPSRGLGRQVRGLWDLGIVPVCSKGLSSAGAGGQGWASS
jgi:hypothetical protein